MKVARAPGPRSMPILGNMLAFRRDPLTFICRMREEYGDLVRLQLGPNLVHLVTHPDLARHVLQGNDGTYVRGGVFYDKLKVLLGEGQLTATGPHWRRQRQLTQPVFNRNRLAPFCKTMAEQAARMFDRWSRASRQNETIDVADEMNALTLSIVSLSVFSVDLGRQASEVGWAATIGIRYTMHRSEALVQLPEFVPTPLRIQFKKALRILDDLIYGIIRERRGMRDLPDDLLSMMMEARDEESGEGMTDEQLRDQVLTMLMAGHETTANALSWAYYSLSRNPKVEEEMIREVDEVLPDKMPEFEDLRRLPYVKMVIEESMRMYAPAWFFGRSVTRDDSMAGYVIPADSMVIVSPHVVHHHPDFWDRPSEFDPSRFDPSRSEKRHQYAYIPFGGGAHFCVGKNLAMMEAVIVMASVTKRFRLDRVPGYVAQPDPGLSMRIRNGLPMYPVER